MFAAIEYLGPVVSLISAFIAFIALVRTRTSTEKQRRLQVAAHVQGYLKGLPEWSNQVITKMTDAAFLCELDPARMKQGEFFEKRRAVRAELSALFDSGRLLLPNENHELVGAWKESAYRGLRQAALDCVERAYNLVEQFDYKQQAPNLPKRQQLVDEKRRFVGEVQEALNVRRTSELIKNLAREIQDT